MLRLLRGVIYGIAAGLTAAFILDFLDREKTAQSGSAQRQLTGKSQPSSPDPSKDLNEDARKALLDELGAQL